MKFIKQEPFLDYEGNPITIGDDSHNATNGEMLALVAGRYTPITATQTSPGLLLENEGDIAKLRKARVILEGKAEDGYYTLEDADFDMLKRVVNFMVLRMPLLLWSAPEISVMFQEATSRLPKELDKSLSKNGKVAKEEVEAR